MNRENTKTIKEHAGAAAEKSAFFAKLFSTISGRIAIIWASILLGLLAFFVMRVVFVQDQHTHYHANFAVFIDGQQDAFSNFSFYEEVQSCSVDDSNDPKTRAHMHDSHPGLVHVHDTNVTWGAFFANLGYGLTDKSITNLNKTYVDGADGKRLVFELNGQKTNFIANRVIGSEDKLLIDYGDGTSIDKEYNQIPNDAHHANITPDPASCSGAHALTFKDRLRRAANFKN